jgi:hypothetical protein
VLRYLTHEAVQFDLGPWSGGAEGEINRLRLSYRAMLAEHTFVVIYAHVAQLQLENVAYAAPGKHRLPRVQGQGARANARRPSRQGMPTVWRSWLG